MTRTARLAVVLAVLAVLAVLGSTAVTVAAYLGRDDADARRTPGAHRSGQPAGIEDGDGVGQTVGGSHGRAAFEVPSAREGWTVQARDTVLYYVDRHGEPSVGVRGAAVFRAGYCRGRTDSNRAFAGFAGSVAGGSVRAVNAELGRRWVRAIALDADLATSGPHTPLRTRDVTLADGTGAVRSTARIKVLRPGVCDAPEVDFAIVSADSGGSVTSVVMVRDTGVPGTLPDEAADEILATLHVVRD
ncbi:MAG: hypothetical protein JWO76_650 [Nocardioides sp.]|nr:hypothetical protein [Nocardioides sp.]